jgi:hypothetical protein
LAGGYGRLLALLVLEVVTRRRAPRSKRLNNSVFPSWDIISKSLRRKSLEGIKKLVAETTLG